MITLQFLPYFEIEKLPSQKRIRKIIDIVKENKIVLLEGRLTKTEETELIKKTMEEINNKFKGIEPWVFNPQSGSSALWEKIKGGLLKFLLGDRRGFTIIGPSTLVKEIKSDPNKVQLFIDDMTKRRRKR